MEDKINYHHRGRDPNFRIWHTLEESMILYTYSEGGSIVGGDKTYPIRRGTLCFVGARRYHYTMPDDPEIYDRSKIFLSPHQLHRMISVLPPDSPLRRFSDDALVYAEIPPEEYDTVEECFTSAYTYRNDKLCADAMHLAAYLKLLALLARYSVDITPSTSGIMSLAIAYINQNIFGELDIDSICSAIHISKYHFCRQFKQHFGMTVMDYILKTRIVMAKGMLRKEKLSVTEISTRCGFSSISYFSRVFKQDTGMTPLQYKKAALEPVGSADGQ